MRTRAARTSSPKHDFFNSLGPERSVDRRKSSGRYANSASASTQIGTGSDAEVMQDARQFPGQYRFFGGNDRLICLRRRATAAAFLRLRSAVGFS